MPTETAELKLSLHPTSYSRAGPCRFRISTQVRALRHRHLRKRPELPQPRLRRPSFALATARIAWPLPPREWSRSPPSRSLRSPSCTPSARSYFQPLAHAQPNHAGLWHLLGEVEVVFGFWAAVLLIFLVTHSGTGHALHYLESRNFTEPAFVFVIMVIAASRPIIDLAGALLHLISRALPLERPVAYYFTLLSVGPLLGSFITEPAAMTLAALLLRQRFFSRNAPKSFMYVTVGVLFVNISIGGTLTPYAAPPVLMVADKWGLDLATMLKTFGWKAALAVVVNAAAAAFAYRTFLSEQPTIIAGAGEAGGAAAG